MSHEDRDWYREDRKRRERMRWNERSGQPELDRDTWQRRGWLRAYFVEALRLLAFIGAVALAWWLFSGA